MESPSDNTDLSQTTSTLDHHINTGTTVTVIFNAKGSKIANPFKPKLNRNADANACLFMNKLGEITEPCKPHLLLNRSSSFSKKDAPQPT